MSRCHWWHALIPLCLSYLSIDLHRPQKTQRTKGEDTSEKHDSQAKMSPWMCFYLDTEQMEQVLWHQPQFTNLEPVMKFGFSASNVLHDVQTPIISLSYTNWRKWNGRTATNMKTATLSGVSIQKRVQKRFGSFCLYCKTIGNSRESSADLCLASREHLEMKSGADCVSVAWQNVLYVKSSQDTMNKNTNTQNNCTHFL